MGRIRHLVFLALLLSGLSCGKEQPYDMPPPDVPDGAGVPYADYYSALVDDDMGLKKEYQIDSIHPNADGYTAMESVIVPILKKVLEDNK